MSENDQFSDFSDGEFFDFGKFSSECRFDVAMSMGHDIEAFCAIDDASILSSSLSIFSSKLTKIFEFFEFLSLDCAAFISCLLAWGMHGLDGEVA